MTIDSLSSKTVLSKDGGPKVILGLFEKPKPSFGIPNQLVSSLSFIFSS
jgi:hypothetical protein